MFPPPPSDTKKLLQSVVSLWKKLYFVLPCARCCTKKAPVTVTTTYSDFCSSLLIYFSKCHVVENNHLKLFTRQFGTSRTYLAQKKESSLKNPFLSFFLFPLPLSLASSVYHCVLLAPLFLLLWVGDSLPSLFERQDWDPDRVSCLALPKDRSFPQPTETWWYWFRGCTNTGGEPSMPSLISHHLSSQTVHWTFPPATITGEWRRKPSRLPLRWEASAQESPVGMQLPQDSSAWTSLLPHLHLHGKNYRAALRLYSCSTQLSDEHSNV